MFALQRRRVVEKAEAPVARSGLSLREATRERVFVFTPINIYITRRVAAMIHVVCVPLASTEGISGR